MPDIGLQQEQKCLEAALALQGRGWGFNGFEVLKIIRTYGHREPTIRNFDGKKKADLVILFRRKGKKPVALVLQVKSTSRSFKKFRQRRIQKRKNPGEKVGQNVKCIWVLPNEPLIFVMADLDLIFKEVLSPKTKKNPFLRRNISAKRIKMICET